MCFLRVMSAVNSVLTNGEELERGRILMTLDAYVCRRRCAAAAGFKQSPPASAALRITVEPSV